MAMTHTADDDGEPIQKRSGWLLPLAVFVVTAALSALVLYYYLGPRPAASTNCHSESASIGQGDIAKSLPRKEIAFTGVLPC